LASISLVYCFFCWLTFVMIPKLYLYRPLEEDIRSSMDEERVDGENNDSDETVDIEEE